MPQHSAAGKRWTSLADGLAQAKRLPGVVPIEDILFYGEKSLLLITLFQFPNASHPGNSCRHALEKATTAFESLAWVHERGISINLWPQWSKQGPGQSCVNSHFLWADDPLVEHWIPYGSLAPDPDPFYAEIVGRRFACRLVARFPPSQSTATFFRTRALLMNSLTSPTFLKFGLPTKLRGIHLSRSLRW
jgi:hypothetical protein